MENAKALYICKMGEKRIVSWALETWQGKKVAKTMYHGLKSMKLSFKGVKAMVKDHATTHQWGSMDL